MQEALRVSRNSVRVKITTPDSGSADSGRAEPVKIWKARKFIDENCAEKVSLGEVARALRMSETYLSEKFREVTGTNFVSYVARTRFENARLLLRNGEGRVSEIAFAVGFQSLSQFNRVFKKLAGKSPTDYRAAYLKRTRSNGSGHGKEKRLNYYRKNA